MFWESFISILVPNIALAIHSLIWPQIISHLVYLKQLRCL